MNIIKKCQNSLPNKLHFQQKTMNKNNETLDINEKSLSASVHKKNNTVRRIPLSKEEIQQGHQNYNNENIDKMDGNMIDQPPCFRNFHHYIYGCNPTINTVSGNYPNSNKNHPGIDHCPYLTDQLSNTSVNTDLLIDSGAERSILTKKTIDTMNNANWSL